MLFQGVPKVDGGGAGLRHFLFYDFLSEIQKEEILLYDKTKGMRVDLETLWDALTNDIPKLNEDCRALLEQGGNMK